MDEFKKLNGVIIFLLIFCVFAGIFLIFDYLDNALQFNNFRNKTEAASLKETKIDLTISSSIVALNGNLQVSATLKDNSSGNPLANKKVTIAYDMGWNYAQYLSTDSQGKISYSLPITNSANRTGFCGCKGSQSVPARYQVEVYFQGDKEYRGVMALGNFQVSDCGKNTSDSVTKTFSSAGSTIKKPEPLIYWMWDYYNLNPNDAPEDLKCPECKPGETCIGGDGKSYACENDPSKVTSYGPFGGLFYQHWNGINYTAIDNYLAKASTMKLNLSDGRQISKPVIYGFYFFDWSGDHSAYSGGSYQLTPSGCATLTAPKYCDSGWQNTYKQAVFNLGAKYDGKFSAILVSFGFDGEAVMAKNSGSCDYKAAITALCSETTFNNLVLQAAEWHKQAFPNTPVYVQGHPFNPQKGIDSVFGYKTNGWVADSGLWTYSNIADYLGESNVWYKYPNLMRALESRYDSFKTGGASDFSNKIYGGTYWMLINMMGNKPDFIDFHRDHWYLFLKLPWLNEFVSSHLGKTAENTPSVWTVMREVQDSIQKEDWGCQQSGTYGDYQFYMYRRDNITGNKTVALTKNDLPTVAQNQPYTNPNETDAGSNKSPTYTARRTDQTSNNNYMSFDIDNGWPYASLQPQANLSYKIVLIYLDKGTDKFSIEYPDVSSNVKKNQTTKINTNKWIRKEIVINDAYFNDQLSGNTDIRIYNENDGDEIVHLLQVVGLGSGSPPSDTQSPSTPANLSATAISSSQINLSWSASTDNVGVTGYRINRCAGAGCTPSTQITTTSNTSYSDTGLTANTAYVYRVAAYDAAGNVSGQSSSASATTQAPADTTPPAAPTGVTMR